jgi:hypothetical protein
LDPTHTYSLAELIDLAERNNPRTRVAWERARQRTEELGVARSAYYPVLAGQAAFSDQRIVSPFPKPLAPRGYVMVEIPAVVPQVELEYLIFDGKRGARVDGATAEKLAAGANLIQANQTVAFRVATAFYQLLTQQERLAAAEATVKTTQATADAAEFQLRNGRSTMPDVLNARAEASQAIFDRESADGDEKIARVNLTEAVGVEPSPNIVVDAATSAPLPSELAASIESLIDRAIADRPDLAAQAAEIRAADDAIRATRSEYWPRVVLQGAAAQTSIWPTADYGQLGNASQATWAAAHSHAELLRQADGLRDQIGKTVAGIRTMNDTIEYEFGVDRRQHEHTGEAILRAALATVAFFWNQFAVLHSERDRDFLTEPALSHLRSGLAEGMDAMARSVTTKTEFANIKPDVLIDPPLLDHSRYGEYVRNSIARFDELRNFVSQLQAQP